MAGKCCEGLGSIRPNVDAMSDSRSEIEVLAVEPVRRAELVEG